MLRPAVLRPVIPALVLVCTLALVLPGVALAGDPPPLEPGDLIGSTGGVGFSIIDLDPATGAGTLRFPVGGAFPISALEFRSDGVLFATQGGGGSSVLTIDPQTGAETLIGVHLFGAVNGLQFVGGTLYGAFFAAGGMVSGGDGGPPIYELVIVDQTDGSLTPVGTMPDYFPIRGLAYDESTATMYGIGVPLPQGVGEPEGLSDVLFTVDPATAATTEIGPTGFFLGGLEFGPDGVLYAGTDGDGGKVSEEERWTSPGGREVLGSAALVSIDTATGVGTLIGATGFPAISALAFFPDQPGPGPGPGQSVLEIPTVGRLGLVLLALLVAGAGLIAVRRS